MKKIKEILNNILHSLKTDKEGYSARKLSAFIIILMVVILHIKWFNSSRWEYVGEILAFDFTFILTCLGLTTLENIKTKDKENESGGVQEKT